METNPIDLGGATVASLHIAFIEVDVVVIAKRLYRSLIKL